MPYSNKVRYTASEIEDTLQLTIHEVIIEEGIYHLHQFSIPDAGIIKKGEIIYPLRFMSGNPTKEHLVVLLEYVRTIGQKVQNNS